MAGRPARGPRAAGRGGGDAGARVAARGDDARAKAGRRRDADRARLIVRAARVDDAAELAALRSVATYEDEPEIEEESAFARRYAQFLEAALSSGRWRVWVAEEGGGILATTAVCVIDKVPRPGSEEGRLGYLTSVYTHPDHRDRGVGTALITELQSWARRDGLELLVVWPSIESRAFYRAHGFDGVDPLVWKV